MGTNTNEGYLPDSPSCCCCEVHITGCIFDQFPKRRLVGAGGSPTRGSRQFLVAQAKTMHLAHQLKMKMQAHPHQMIQHQMSLLKLATVVKFDIKVVPAGSGAFPGVYADGMPIFIAHELPPFATLTDATGVDLTLIDDANNKPGTTLKATMCVNNKEEHTR